MSWVDRAVHRPTLQPSSPTGRPTYLTKDVGHIPQIKDFDQSQSYPYRQLRNIINIRNFQTFENKNQSNLQHTV